MVDRIKQRRDTAANWTTYNPVLGDGELGFERDTGRAKLGDGVTAWALLAYLGAYELSRANHTGAQAISTVTGLQTALDGKEVGGTAAAAVGAHEALPDPHPQYTTAGEAAAAAPVQSVAGRTGDVVLAKGDVGLGNVDNTSDADKPISTATQAALDGKSATGHDHAASYAALSHAHDASAIVSGTIDLARLPAAAVERTAVVADDAARFALTTATVQMGDVVRVQSTGLMYYVVDDGQLAVEAGYSVFSAGTAASVPWSGVAGKPSTFAPGTHSHPLADITDKGTLASQNANAVEITGGSIDGAVIGGTTPATGSFTTLSASGEVHVTSASDIAYKLTKQGAKAAKLKITSSGLVVGVDGADGDTEVGRFNESGLNVAGTASASGLQITSNATNSTGSGVEILGGATGTVQAYDRTGGAYLNLSLDGLSVAAKVSGATRGLFDASGLAVTGALSATGTLSVAGGNMLVAADGNVTNINNSYGAISDVKLKENVTDATPKLSKLLQVRIASYNLKTDPTHRQLGVIAQELERVFPGLVEPSDDFETVTKTRTVTKTVPVTTKQTRTSEVVAVDVVDGKAVRTVTTKTEYVDVPVVDTYPVFDADGAPVIELYTPEVPEVMGKGGEVVTPYKAATYKQAMHAVARTGTVEETETYTEQLPTGTVTKSVKYSVFVPMLIKAVQEQQALIEALAARISALEAA